MKQWQLEITTIPESNEEVVALIEENRSLSTGVDSGMPKPDEREVWLEQLYQYIGLSKADVNEVADHVLEAVSQEKHIVVFGDYDADGITAASTVWLALDAIGYAAQPFIPNRHVHGYGISDKALDELLSAEKKPDMIITVDNGIVAHEPIQRAKKAGIEVILTDHHTAETNEVGEKIYPPAKHRVHTTKLAGAGVAWVLAERIVSQHGSKQAYDLVWELLELVTIGTLADQVPLLQANRMIAQAGLAQLQQTKRPGLQALLQQLNSTDSVTTSTIHFQIAPQINAIGRLGDATDAMRLLCTKSLRTARTLAADLKGNNAERKETTQAGFDEAFEQALAQNEQHLLVITGEFHEGVIGLIAGRIAEKLWKPTLVISVGEEMAKGSARSIPGINITDLLRTEQKNMESVGGHPMAAGCSIACEKLEMVVTNLQTTAKEQITAEQLVPRTQVTMELPASLVDLELFDALHVLEPFGKANPAPLFWLKNWQVLDVSTIGRDSTHLKVWLRDPESGLAVTALGWRKADRVAELEVGNSIELLAQLDENIWNNKRSLQLVLKDFRNQNLA